ncbi:MAG: 3-hydroxyacyl-CoA dehydrogenase NAD-binding domain-containing protein [Candidatus Melainabacteria bacterium]|nr:3-hydroxyacyl-CoA dehydrogenase NAD-binding domain-containing protein [Candidatus Melainabacteria bacterium]
MQISSVAVIGAGTMGASIAVALISHGYPVILKEANDDLLKKGLANVDKIQKKRIEKGLDATTADEEMNRLTGTTDYARIADADLVIEAVPENIDIKRAVLNDIDEHSDVNAIIATNTSSLPITQIAAFTRRPDKVIGLHFFNPAHLMRLVEVIPGLETSPETVESALAFGQSLGKLAVRVDECPSFLVNRLLGRYMNEALYCLQEGLATIEEIDEAAKQFAVPVGPLSLRDMNGADIGLAVAKFNFQEYGERFAPPEILEKMVERNMLGRKTGSGFYIYDEKTGQKQKSNPQIGEILKEIKTPKSASKFDVERLFLPMINEAFIALQERVCAVEDLDPALMAGLGMRRGPLTIASDIGLKETLDKMEELHQTLGERFRPALLLKRLVWAKRATIF